MYLKLQYEFHTQKNPTIYFLPPNHIVDALPERVVGGLYNPHAITRQMARYIYKHSIISTSTIDTA